MIISSLRHWCLNVSFLVVVEEALELRFVSTSLVERPKFRSWSLLSLIPSFAEWAEEATTSFSFFWCKELVDGLGFLAAAPRTWVWRGMNLWNTAACFFSAKIDCIAIEARRKDLTLSLMPRDLTRDASSWPLMLP